MTEAGIAGGNAGIRSTVPAVVPVAALAGAVTFFVTWFGYRSERALATSAADHRAERPTDEIGSEDEPVAVGRS